MIDLSFEDAMELPAHRLRLIAVMMQERRCVSLRREASLEIDPARTEAGQGPNGMRWEFRPLQVHRSRPLQAER